MTRTIDRFWEDTQRHSIGELDEYMAAIPLQQTKKCMLADVPFNVMLHAVSLSSLSDARIKPDPRPPLTDLGPLEETSNIHIKSVTYSET